MIVILFDLFLVCFYGIVRTTLNIMLLLFFVVDCFSEIAKERLGGIASYECVRF